MIRPAETLPFDPAALDRGHAVHFRCRVPAAEGLRVDVMTRLRAMPEFEVLWERLIEEDLPTRGSLAGIIRTAAAAGREVLVTINNKAEGSAPLSVQKLAEAVVAETCGP